MIDIIRTIVDALISVLFGCAVAIGVLYTVPAPLWVFYVFATIISVQTYLAFPIREKKILEQQC